MRGSDGGTLEQEHGSMMLQCMHLPCTDKFVEHSACAAAALGEELVVYQGELGLVLLWCSLPLAAGGVGCCSGHG